MKRKIHIKLFIAIIFLLTVYCGINQAQSREEMRRQEHQAVINLINDYISKHPAKVSSGSSESNGKYDYAGSGLRKTTGFRDRKSFLMNGNKIKVGLTNYGGIGEGYGGIREITELVWHGSPYIFQFSPLVGASVPDSRNPQKRIHIISDGLNDWPSWNLPEVSPKGDTLWQWEPLPGYADPNQAYMASNPCDDLDHDGKPDSWPSEWYNSTLGKYVWPGYLTQGVNNADLECFWSMDDRDNAEFSYFPFKNDLKRRGLGVQIDGRAFQWSNSLAENAIFFVYTITNVSDYDLDSVFFGVYGDPDVGNAADNKDDLGFFVPPYSTPDVNVDQIPVYSRSMVYFYDNDGIGAQGIKLGYLGCKFLESPGNSSDGIDNDGDGLVDERQDDGIDNDHDWNAETDDVGKDGIAGTGDEGENDGKPTAGGRLADGSPDPLFPGEPNFELTDLDEVDQIGLTSFNSWIWKDGGAVKDDELMWTRSIPGTFSPIPNKNDIVFNYGSGYISLKKGETKRISMALLFGENLGDLLTTAETVQDIYNKNYNFFKPPDLPKVTAVPGDKKVTLYWDTKAESSKDPITGNDFEGYVIYRSTDPTFTDILTISDGKGAGFLSEPLKDLQGYDARWDMDNAWKGFHPVAYQGRGVHYFLGDNTGLVHSFVDSNNVINGQTYYYAVVAYDHGDSLGIPPSETTKKITLDPVTSQYKFDANTVQVIPGPRASGYMLPEVDNGSNLLHSSGLGNGRISFSVYNDLLVKDNEYRLVFSDSMLVADKMVKAKNYSLSSSNAVTESFVAVNGKFTELGNRNLVKDEVMKVTDENGTVYTEGADYIINYIRGAVQRMGNSRMADGGRFNITYHYYPIFQSTSLTGDDSNPVFDGISLKIQDEKEVSVDSSRSGFNGKNSNLTFSSGLYAYGKNVKNPSDYEITFSSSNNDSTFLLESGKLVKTPVNFSIKDITSGVPVPVVSMLVEQNSTKNKKWDIGEDLVLFKPGSKGTQKDTLTWDIKLRPPKDTSKAAVMPGDGDILKIFTKRPFTSKDIFVLKTTAAKISTEKASASLDNIRVVPNPYVGYNELEPLNRLPDKNRGERRIYFDNLPPQCTIRIFTLSGDPVRTIVHDSNMQNGREFWNLLNRDGFGVAYGLYIAHIEAPGIGEKLVKFALIK
ncbi:MAG: hypothetical protein ACM3UR_06280 [Bacteroidota bacterium]|jgi:hypothetical protein|nr:hypothetical protein [Ignavibacteria bacterium]MCU7498307.1 hypothetical protein [Ignavibacteria bacterium]MCU7512660.1 hypothetical protein [Ignavibacteria bacterium]MCU7520201.1 hypothetical protein [Ignavibacteria bacterium]MCU7523678.1 hypothetical protein [Ignavibacteria bacterium]